MEYCTNCERRLELNELLTKDIQSPHGAARVYFCPHCHAPVRDEMFFDFGQVVRLPPEKIRKTPEGWKIRFERYETAWCVLAEGNPILMVFDGSIEESKFWFAEIRSFTMRTPSDCMAIAVFHRSFVAGDREDREKFYIVYEFDPPVKYFVSSRSREEDLSPVGKVLFKRLTTVP